MTEIGAYEYPYLLLPSGNVLRWAVDDSSVCLSLSVLMLLLMVDIDALVNAKFIEDERGREEILKLNQVKSRDRVDYWEELD